MKQPRNKISSLISEKTLKSGISKSFSKEVAAYLLVENRTSDLSSILRDVSQKWADSGIVEVVAISAFPISIEVSRDIKAEVKKIYPDAKKIIITEQHDPVVIAGVKIEIANQQLDLSIQSKLNKFKQLSVSRKDA